MMVIKVHEKKLEELKHMKIKKKRILSGIWAILIIFAVTFTLLACGDTKNTGNTGKDNTTAANDDSPTDAVAEQTTELQSPIPKDIKFGGEEIRILNCTYFAEDWVFMHTEEENGDIVNDSIYRRDMKVQGDLDVKFNFIDVALLNGYNFKGTVKKSVSSGADDYDIIIGVQYDIVQIATDGLFANLRSAPYIDLDKPWWPSPKIQEELTIGKDVLYFLTGDISLNFVRNMGCAYFNKQVYTNNFGHPEDMYKLVLDGKWTLDKLDEMCRGMYKDLNGDGKADNDDQYGCGVVTSNLTDHFTLAAGVRITEKDDQGMPYLVMNNERTVSYTEKLYSLFYANEGVRIFPSTEESNNVTIPKKFQSNELLFDFGWFYISEYLRNMPADYGIIPFPKYDESQPTYLSLAHDIVPLYCVPMTCEKTDAVGAVLESMSFESYRTLLPAYYEIALKLKYTRDTAEDAFTIIDMIHDNCTTNFGYIYNIAIGNIGWIMRDLMTQKKSDFASHYEKMESKVQKNIEKIIDAYLDN